MARNAAEVTRNTALIAARRQMGFSQEDLARRIQETGHRLGHPNSCNRANVDRWEHGGKPQPRYVLLLEATLNKPASELGFAYETHGMDRDQIIAEGGLDVAAPVPEGEYAYGPLTGIWLSEYVYHSDSRANDYTGRHHVLILQRGAHLNVRSLPKQSSRLSLDLSANGRMVKGTWTEHTNESGYYQGSVYDGMIQLELNGSENRMKGKWLGFGRNPGEINDGPWQFTKITERVDHDAREEHDHENWNTGNQAETP